MDARPQRPLRALHIVADENVDAKQTLHQRHKSTGTLPTQRTILGAGGLKMAAKRTAFGDVSNVTKHVGRDDLVTIGKSAGYDALPKPVIVQEKTNGFLRPAQRLLNPAGVKSLNSNKENADANANVSIATTQQVPAEVPQGQLTRPRAGTKRSNTTIYKDTSTDNVSSSLSLAGEVSVAPVHQTLVPRHHKSYPHMKVTAPTIRKVFPRVIATQIEARETVPAASVQVAEVVDVRGNVEAPRADYNTFESLTSHDLQENAEPVKSVENDTVETYKHDDRHNRELPALPLMSEPEEYWEEEEEEEIYDDQGYTTAHSYRSRGDNTTGGATTVLFPKVTNKIKKELALAKEIIENSRTQEEIEDEAWDTSMVAEYGDEIFSYMRELEMKMLPNAHYMDNQAEIQWSMRSVLMDWLIQVHHRFTLLPETLFLCVNYIDRFLSCKVVSLNKLQLVGATAIFVAAKYEEINCPSVNEIVYMVDGGYTVDEILKAERFMLSLLQFELGWPGPMSFLRRISKADDYDLETRTLAKYFLEVTIMDERFVGSPPSYTAAGSHCLSRLMLGKGDWSTAHIYYSGYTYVQLRPLICMMYECLIAPEKHHSAVFEKYSDKRYKRASHFVQSKMRQGFTVPNVAQYYRPSLSPASSSEQQLTFQSMIEVKG